jgi:hypothetical protein
MTVSSMAIENSLHNPRRTSLFDSNTPLLCSGDKEQGIQLSFRAATCLHLYATAPRMPRSLLRGCAAAVFTESIKSRVLLEQIRTARLSKPSEIDLRIIERENELIGQLNAYIKKRHRGHR